MHTLYDKIRKSVVLMLIISMLFCGCTTYKDINKSDMEKENNAALDYKYDEQTYQKSVGSRAAFTDEGFIFLVNGMLYYYDMTDNEAVPMCSDMTCDHNDSDCKAYALDKKNYDPYDLSGVSVNCLGNMVWYENKHIYMIKREESGDYLMEYDAQFNNEKKVVCLANNGSIVGMPSADTENAAIVYDNYIYYYSVKPTKANELVSQDYNTTVTCKRAALDGSSEAEELGSFLIAIDYSIFPTGSYGKLCIGNDCIYYVAGGTTRFMSKDNPVQYRICRYNIKTSSFEQLINVNSQQKEDILGTGTGNVQPVNNDIVTADNNDSLYIVTDNNRIIKMSSDGEVEEIYHNENAECIMSLRSQNEKLYFYEKIPNGGNIKLLNQNYEVVGTFSLEKDKSISLGEYGISDVYIYGVDNNNIYIRLNDNNVLNMKNENIEGFNQKHSEAGINTYSVYLIEIGGNNSGDNELTKIYNWHK